MCLAIPGQIMTTSGVDIERCGEVRFGTVSQTVSLGYLPEAAVGDFVLVHAGCAIAVLDEDEARESLDAITQWQGQIR